MATKKFPAPKLRTRVEFFLREGDKEALQEFLEGILDRSGNGSSYGEDIEAKQVRLVCRILDALEEEFPMP